mgnify:CR=1 FL=1
MIQDQNNIIVVFKTLDTCIGTKIKYKDRENSQTEYRDLIIQETSLEAHIRDVINRFVRTRRVDKGKSPGRRSLSEEVVDELRRLEQNPQISKTDFLSSQEFLLQHEIEQWMLQKIF